MIESLHAIVGAEGVVPTTELHQVGDSAPSTVVAPSSEAEVVSLLECARGLRLPLVVAGSGTHLTALNPPSDSWWLLCTRRMNRVIDYSPEDLVITVGAGMTLAEMQAHLERHRQYLPWNVPLPEQATIGGIVASNRAGSWRYRYGTPRDILLAVRAVRGDGVAFKSGAKVVKSVAGYDLHRLLCGSWGTLAVITEITLKVSPLPQEREAVGWYTSWEQLEPTLAELMRSPLQPDGISVVCIRGRQVSGSRQWAFQGSREWGVGSEENALTRPTPTLPVNGEGAKHSPLPLGEGLGVGVEERQRARATGNPLTLPCPPSPDASGEGGSQTPLTHSTREGQGVRVEERQGARATGNPLTLPCPPSPDASGEGGSQTPLSHSVGEGLGVRATENLTPPAPLSASREGGVAQSGSPSPFTERGQGGEVHYTTPLLFSPTQVGTLLLERTEPEVQEQTQLLDDDAPITPFIFLEFSGTPEGIHWQIRWLVEHGFPAEPVHPEQLAYWRDLLAPRAHTLLIKLLMRPSEVADALLNWTALGAEGLAHAGSGILYIWCDMPETVVPVLERLRETNHKYQILNLPSHWREEAPRTPQPDALARLSAGLKQAFDPDNLLPKMP